MKITNNLKALSLLVFALLSSCTIKHGFNYTKMWNGNDNPGHCSASFEEFNGVQDFDIKHDANDQFYVKYTTHTESGKLHLKIKLSSKVILDRDVTGDVRDSIKIDHTDGGRIKLILEADHAKGSFDVRYDTSR
jgi:hypothetical protein